MNNKWPINSVLMPCHFIVPSPQSRPNKSTKKTSNMSSNIVKLQSPWHLNAHWFTYAISYQQDTMNRVALFFIFFIVKVSFLWCSFLTVTVSIINPSLGWCYQTYTVFLCGKNAQRFQIQIFINPSYYIFDFTRFM
jgi:hypothetical protein